MAFIARVCSREEVPETTLIAKVFLIKKYLEAIRAVLFFGEQGHVKTIGIEMGWGVSFFAF